MRFEMRLESFLPISDCLLVVYSDTSSIPARNPNQNVDFFDSDGNLIWTAEDIGEEFSFCYRENDDEVRLNSYGAIYKVDLDTGKLEFVFYNQWM